MASRIAHRGPDDEGFWSDPANSVGLAHRRLSIIDLSLRGHNPLWDVKRRAAIIYNGELYNYRELRRELVADGYRFNSDTDTEVLLNGRHQGMVSRVSQFRGVMMADGVGDHRIELPFGGDHFTDLFVVNESGPLTLSADELARSPAHARLFRNRGDGTFEDVTETSGLGVRGIGMGAAWGDYDGDSDLDLFVTRYGTNVLFRNEGKGRFRDVSEATRIGGSEGFWTGISLADYDRDGDLDAYVCGYVRYQWDASKADETSRQFKAVVPYTLNPSSYTPERNLLLRNDAGVFVEVAQEAGVDNPSGRSLSASWCDFDGDGWPDLYVANDISDNAMYHNLGNGR